VSDTLDRISTHETHEVFNQAPPFSDVDLYALDLPLREAVEREGAA
jgi:putative acyl-CoA dehydrogenase